MSFLLDTNIISLIAPRARRTAHPEVVARLERLSTHYFLSVVTSAEIRAGILKAQRAGAQRKADELDAWWRGVESLYVERILPFDREAATIAANLLDRVRTAGGSPDFADIVIASTAAAKGLTVMTRNVRHFEPMGIAVFDPLAEP